MHHACQCFCFEISIIFILFFYAEKKMADKRKLQAEMDRCFKKIQEGVDAFEDTWQKLHHANNANQKDKYENDLKKEIKKLQRLRDQIKSWASSNDVKDKKTLLDYRKLIETQMERFKVVERETKTKAYSKEGLVSAAKVDPAQKAKDETRQWMQQMLDTFNIQIDCYESEIESLNSQSRKKKFERDKQDRVDTLKSLLEKHRFHVKNLETLMRMMDNQKIQPDKINVIRDDVEYYLESCTDPDFEDNEFLYEDMGLDESIASNIAVTAVSPTEKQLNSSITSNSKDEEDKIERVSSPSPVSNHVWPAGKEEDSRKRLKSEEFVSPRKPVNNNSNSQRVATSRSVSNPAASVATATSNKQNQNSANSSHNQAYASAASGVGTQLTPSKQTGPTQFSASKAESEPISKKPLSIQNDSSWLTSNHVTESKPSNAEVQSAINSIVSSVASLSVTANGDTLTDARSDSTISSEATSNLTNPQSGSSLMSSGSMMSNIMQNGPISLLNKINSLKNIPDPPKASSNADENSSVSPVYSQNSPDSFGAAPLDTRPDLASLVKAPNASNQQGSPSGGEAHIEPLLGVAPLGIASLTKDQVYQQAMLEACWRHMPHPSDAERLRHYLPRNPCPTPTYYPQSPLLRHDTLEFYLRLSTETLFFIFYYMEASKAQYMAAKALKKQSWRFHTKYMMWFQRHEEPKTITDEFEQGTYIYFDYEKWGQRKKEGFTFEYRYLEDRELP